MEGEWEMKIKLVILLFKGRMAAQALGNTQGQIRNETENQCRESSVRNH